MADEIKKLSGRLKEHGTEFNELKEQIIARGAQVLNLEKIVEKARLANEQDPNLPGPEEEDIERINKEKKKIQDENAKLRLIGQNYNCMLDKLNELEKQASLKEAETFSEEFDKQAAELQAAKQAKQPEKAIVLRSGEECVVVLCDQSYFHYREQERREKTTRVVELMECFCDEVRRNFNFTLGRSREHACSRSYGLGSRLS